MMNNKICGNCGSRYDAEINNKCPKCKNGNRSLEELASDDVKTIHEPVESELSQNKEDTDDD